MKIRTKFTLTISISSLFAAVLFSSFIYTEMIEEPHKLINRELLDTGNAIINSILKNKATHFEPSDTDYPLERYWIKLTRQDGKLIYSSPLAAKVNIPLQHERPFYTVTRQLSPHSVWTDPQDNDDLDELKGDQVEFKVLVLTTEKEGEKITLIIAKPLAMFIVELQELIQELLLYILISTTIIVLMSYFLAGKLLQPLGSINRKIRDIRENSLNERIPAGKSRDELHTLSVSLNSMFDRLHNSFKRQKEFISSASHEMRSPLTILMLGQEEMLSHKLPNEIRTELSGQLNTLRRLSKLVKDLLDISLLEKQDFIDRTEIRLPLLIEKVLEDYDEMLQAKQIECTFRAERIRLLADYDKLLRVFINLFDNAIKYNKESNGSIYITTKKKNNNAIITIANTGMTIPAEDLPLLFKQFYRVEKSRSKQHGGTGLGLTIVKKIIELHGGSTWIESRDNIITVTITLPLA